METQEIKILKWKKRPGDIIPMCTTNENHMMYGSWDMESTTQNFFSFWTIFCPFTPLTPQKIKILKKWKKRLKISSFYSCVPKIIIICVTVREIWRVTNVIFIFHFGLFFAFLVPYQPKNLNFKGKKTSEDVIILLICTKIIRWCTVPEMRWATDGRTDGRKEGHH